MVPANPPVSRRQCLALGSTLLAGAGIACVAASPARAMSKADKRDFNYQDKPKDGKSCSNCKMFQQAAGGSGRCAIVDGDVSPNGWCMAYTPRS